MLQKNVIETIKKYNLIEPKDSIVIGVSGGPDSMALLDILMELKNSLNITIAVAHINHMIRKEATSDEEYVEKYCKKNNIPFYSIREDVEKLAKENKIGTEEARKKFKIQFF